MTGCVHGNLDLMYRKVMERNVHLVLCTGDFEAIRDTDDLHSLSCPEKYRCMGDFHKYYSGQTRAPVLTVLIGGNHEAVKHMNEFPEGG